MDTQQEVALRICPQCGYESPQDAQFCIECGESLSTHTGPTTYLGGPICEQCGNAELIGARYCRLCGQALSVETSVGQPWVARVSPPPPHLHQALPALAAQPQAVPQGSLPSSPFVPTTPPNIAPHKRFSMAGIIVLVGLALLLFTKAFTWPLLLLVLGAAYIVTELEKGRTNQALTVLACLGVATLFWSQPRLLSMIGRGWPMLFFFFFFFKKRSHRP